MDEELRNPPSSTPQGFQPVARVSYRPILITLLCAFLLGGGTCFGFLNTLNFNGGSSVLNDVFAVAFVLCALTFIGSAIWAFVRWIKNQNR
jgi:hypothetical protein